MSTAPVIECWSADEENYNATSLGELFDNHEELKPGSTVWRGEAVAPNLENLYDATDVIDHLADRAYDIAGEHADGYPDVGPEAIAELNALVRSWIERHAMPTFYTVTNVKPHVLNEDDFGDTNE